MIEFSNQNLISIKLRPWEDENASKMLEDYKGQAIPLLIFLNSEGQEVDRVLGFYPADEYLAIIRDIYNGKDTYLSLKEAYNQGNKDLSIISKLAIKCDDNRDPKFCKDVYSEIINVSDEIGHDILFKAELFFANDKLLDGNEESLINLIEKNSDKDYVVDAYYSIIQHYMISSQSKLEAEYYRKFTDQFKNDSSVLNGYAWRMSELGINLEDALEKSTIAINLLEKEDEQLKSYILDTKAELLWLLGRNKEAIDAINLAIKINLDSEYFKEQKLKFEESIK